MIRPPPTSTLLSLHDALPICTAHRCARLSRSCSRSRSPASTSNSRSEEHTSELQSHSDLVCRLLLEKKKLAEREQFCARHQPAADVGYLRSAVHDFPDAQSLS